MQAHPGVGPLTALATMVTLAEIGRFDNGRKVASYLGLIPIEDSGAGRQHFGHLTKQGNHLLRDQIDYAEFLRSGSHAGMPGVSLV